MGPRCFYYFVHPPQRAWLQDVDRKGMWQAVPVTHDDGDGDDDGDDDDDDDDESVSPPLILAAASHSSPADDAWRVPLCPAANHSSPADDAWRVVPLCRENPAASTGTETAWSQILYLPPHPSPPHLPPPPLVHFHTALLFILAFTSCPPLFFSLQLHLLSFSLFVFPSSPFLSPLYLSFFPSSSCPFPTAFQSFPLCFIFSLPLFLSFPLTVSLVLSFFSLLPHCPAIVPLHFLSFHFCPVLYIPSFLFHCIFLPNLFLSILILSHFLFPHFLFFLAFFPSFKFFSCPSFSFPFHPLLSFSWCFHPSLPPLLLLLSYREMTLLQTVCKTSGLWFWTRESAAVKPANKIRCCWEEISFNIYYLLMRARGFLDPPGADSMWEGIRGEGGLCKKKRFW